MNDNLYDEILIKIEEYVRAIKKIGFSTPEQEKLAKSPKTQEELLAAIDVIIESSKELNDIFECCHSSMFVADSDGKTLRINKAFEKMVKLDRKDVIGRNVADFEEQGMFRPSVCLLTLKEKREVSVLQEIHNTKGMAVTGEPVFDENGEIYRVVTNAVSVDYVKSLETYLTESKKKENKEYNLTKIIGKSKQMLEIIGLADTVKDTESNILITGETGVGKGILANYIHETGNRRKYKIVHINCGAIPENLLESELFGYESGAFSGADKKGKQGLIELSHKGTIFLDEISELPILLQVKLLHFIQSKKITRIGGTKEIAIDVRIIAATNKSLLEEIENGQFRLDLFYRLNVIPIYIPPLRERKEDIRLLAEYFIEYFKEKYKKEISISDEIMGQLAEKDWKGNIRELENYIERLVVTNQSEKYLEATEKQDEKEIKIKKISLEKSINEVEKSIVLEAYEKYRSSYKVAEILGVSQATAYRKIKKYL